MLNDPITFRQPPMVERTGSFVHLPKELDYLIGPATKYGRYQFDDDVDRFLENATDADLNALAGIAERILLNDHDDLIGRFLDKYPITDFAESANLYFLSGVIDAADVVPEDDSWNTVENHIKSLQKKGSYRLASERMWGARFLVEFGPEAGPAIPFLEQALSDDDQRVQVWAHFALAVLIGDRKIHENAIRAVFTEHNAAGELDDVGMEAEEALEKLAETAS